MIESIAIKNVATFDSVGIQINNLKKVNFIYGTNGTGKTTISKYIENPSDSLYSNCAIAWKGNYPIKALVYNKNFREKNFRGQIDGVFILGQATREQIELIERKKNRIE